jgi:hypothetical protein
LTVNFWMNGALPQNRFADAMATRREAGRRALGYEVVNAGDLLSTH